MLKVAFPCFINKILFFWVIELVVRFVFQNKTSISSLQWNVLACLCVVQYLTDFPWLSRVCHVSVLSPWMSRVWHVCVLMWQYHSLCAGISYHAVHFLVHTNTLHPLLFSAISSIVFHGLQCHQNNAVIVRESVLASAALLISLAALFYL